MYLEDSFPILLRYTLVRKRKTLPMKTFFLLCLNTLLLGSIISPARSADSSWRAGAAKTDITPIEPVRLSGYGNRTESTREVDDRLFVRAMAFQHADQPISIIVSIDAIGLSATLTDRICTQISERFKIGRNQLVLCTTHSHTAPQLEDVLTNLLSTPLSDQERTHSIDYSKRVVDSVLQVAGKAMQGMQPATLGFGTGRAEFAINRRVLKDNVWSGFGTVADGPVDRTVRVIHAKRLDGSTLAVAYQYACHCTSISPALNRISADWAGLSATKIEESLRADSSQDAIALPIIGCGADANPNPRGTYENAVDHAHEMAAAVQTICNGKLADLPPIKSQTFQFIALAPERPTRDQLKTLSESKSVTERNFAVSMLDTLKRKGRIPETYPAPVHLWNFGDSLAWVFMGGEVVVDYQMRLEKELSQFQNVWVAGYTDDVFAYVASERLRNEGGYEVDASMLYYNQPGRWVSGTEDVLVTRILEMARQKRPQDQPMSPQESWQSIQTPKGWTTELIAAEPIVEDPVNLAFGADGTVWILEMGDYPSGGAKSGRLKRLADKDGDGKFESSSVFLDNLSFPSGIYPWRDGVVVASAPDVFIAYDRNQDGKADERRVLLTGFPLANPQHRVHGFTYGLDHRLHFGTGSGVNEIIEVATGNRIKANGSDLSLDVDAGKVYLETGSTQYIRGCDDWGNWFGNDNSHPLFHYVWDRAWTKNTRTPIRALSQHAMQPPSAPPVFPISRDADRFNDLFAANRFTSACSSIICRSPGATPEMQGHALVCESVHNLVSRIRLERDGASFVGSRFDEDRQSEWLRSSDPWFRPVRVENAPDGTIWVVDMYRRVIEHPEWIPDDWQRRIDLRAGEDRGRIYRLFRSDFIPYQTTDWTKARDPDLLMALQSPSSAIADFARQQIIWRAQSNPEVRERLIVQSRNLLRQAEQATVRLRGLSVLTALSGADSSDWLAALNDNDERVVRWSIESLARKQQVQGEIRDKLLQIARTGNARNSAAVALHLIVALVTCDTPAYPEAAELWGLHAGDRWIDLSIALLPNSGIDSVIEHFLANSNTRTAGMVNQLVLNASPKLQQQLRDQIARGSLPRPAWHFTLSRQFSTSEDKSLALEQTTVDELTRNSVAVIHDQQSNQDLRRSALAWFLSRLGPKDREKTNLLVQILKSQELDNGFHNQLVKSLVSMGSSGLESLFAEWMNLNSDVQASVVSACLSNQASTKLIIDQTARGVVAITSFQPSQIEQLRTILDKSTQTQVDTLFGPPPGADRLAIVQDYTRQWPTKVDTVRGESLHKQHCAQCHQDRQDANGPIPAVGPNLTALAGWKNDAWLTAIFDPNRSVEAKYRRIQIRTDDGQTLVGLKIRESNETIELVNDQGQLISLSRGVIDEIRESEKSLMPEGFEKVLKPDEVASLVSYLRSTSVGPAIPSNR